MKPTKPDQFLVEHQSTLLLLLFLLLGGSLFFRLGLQPLYQEEPRRALIALEMLFNRNLFVPTEFGELYFKKPPLWNWMIILAYKIFGQYSETAVRFFTPLSFLGMGVLIYLSGRKYVSREFGVLASFLFLVSSDIYLYFSLLGEIDIFYSLITFTSFLAVFHYYGQRAWYRLFITVYLLGALGFLTKGFPTVLFTGITLVVFFIWKRDFKRLFSLAHFTGILVFLLIVGSYYYAYSRYHDPLYFIEILWSRSSQRTFLETGNPGLLIHMLVFPLRFIRNLIPASFLVFFLFRKDLFSGLRENRFIAFIVLVFLANAFVYWISPGTRDRYVYMLYPLLVMVFSYFYLYAGQHRNWQVLVYRISGGLLISAAAAASLALPFLEIFSASGSVWQVAIPSALLLICLLYLFLRTRITSIYVLIMAMILVRIVMSFTLLPMRATSSEAAHHKSLAFRVSNLTGDEPVCLFRETIIPRTMVFYLEREKEQVVPVMQNMTSAGYYFATTGFEVAPAADSVFSFSDGKGTEFILWYMENEPNGKKEPLGTRKQGKGTGSAFN